MKILVRGDCCSRRAIVLNGELFGQSPLIIADEKQPTRFLLERLDGIVPDMASIKHHLRIEELDELQLYYFESQFKTVTLDIEDADLICMDSYADMNFKSFKHRRDGWSVWLDTYYIKDIAAFEEEFVFRGRTSLQQAVEDTKRLIEHYRRLKPGIPILYLAQPVSFYPKLRRHNVFNKIGEILAQEVENLFFGGIAKKSELVPEDLQDDKWTLHFDAKSYAKMVHRAVKAGLPLDAIKRAGFFNTVVEIVDKQPVTRRDRLRKLGFQREPKHYILQVENFAECVPFCDVFMERRFPSLAAGYISDSSSKDGWDRVHMPLAFEVLANAERKRSENDNTNLFVEPFDWRAYVEDRWLIDKASFEAQHNGQTYAQTLEQLGPLPVSVSNPTPKGCSKHWAVPFGIFRNEPGRKSGDAVLNKRLLGFILPERFGDLVYLPPYRAHPEISGIALKLLIDALLDLFQFPAAEWQSNVRTVMYGAIETVDRPTLDALAREGFEPMRLARRARATGAIKS